VSQTLADVWDAALLRLGLPEDDGYWSQEFKRLAVSTSQREVAARVDWPELAVETTITVADGDTNPFDLPGDENFLRLKWVSIDETGGNLLIPRDRRDTLQWDDQDASRGTSRYYSVVSDGLGQLALWISPIPAVDEVIRISYMRKPAPILNDTDELQVADHMVEAIVLRTMYHAAIRKGDLARASEVSGEFESQMRTLNDEVLTSRGPLRPRVRQDGI
jgi:hypothetical protein